MFLAGQPTPPLDLPPTRNKAGLNPIGVSLNKAKFYCKLGVNYIPPRTWMAIRHLPCIVFYHGIGPHFAPYFFAHLLGPLSSVFGTTNSPAEAGKIPRNGTFKIPKENPNK